jgi:hypothetical protein
MKQNLVRQKYMTGYWTLLQHWHSKKCNIKYLAFSQNFIQTLAIKLKKNLKYNVCTLKQKCLHLIFISWQNFWKWNKINYYAGLLNLISCMKFRNLLYNCALIPVPETNQSCADGTSVRFSLSWPSQDITEYHWVQMSFSLTPHHSVSSTVCIGVYIYGRELLQSSSVPTGNCQNNTFIYIDWMLQSSIWHSCFVTGLDWLSWDFHLCLQANVKMRT